MNSTLHPPSGLWQPQQIRFLYYGPGAVEKHLASLLPTPHSKAMIITGSSLATRTPLVKQVQDILTPAHHAGTCSAIKQHAPIADLERAAADIQDDLSVDTIISIGGGSPIDSAKWISNKIRDVRKGADSSHGRPDIDGFLFHISIPTTLSAAEVTTHAGYTTAQGLKTTLSGSPLLAPQAIIYDSIFARYTPKKLWISSGIRALDHAAETMYHPSATEVPARAMALYAAGALFRDLPVSNSKHPDDDELSIRLFLAAFASLEYLGRNMTGGLGLSHTLGYALGAPYGIPHGECSCLTLGSVVKLKAVGRPEDAEQIARLLPYVKPEAPKALSGTVQDADRNRNDALQVGDEIMKLVQLLGLRKSPSDYGVGIDQVETITKRALDPRNTGNIDAAQYDSASKLVRGLFEQTANI